MANRRTAGPRPAVPPAPAAPPPAEPAGWRPDILGPGFEQLTLHLPEDRIATLVHRQPDPEAGRAPRMDVLYVHGWSDYFFQKELAQYWIDVGARFFALDLHNYGRSLRPGDTPGFVTDLAEYDADIAAALQAMGRRDPAGPGGAGTPGNPGTPQAGADLPLVLLGHSTGGLTLSLWAARHPGVAAALILNSPWLEFQGAELGRRAISPLINLEAARNPRGTLPAVDSGNYSRAVSAAFGGEWHYNSQWRPVRGFTATTAFIHAVFRGQAAVARGLHLDLPVLVLLSTRSYLQPRWSPEVRTSDVALDVNVVAHRALSLGNTVSIIRIPDAMHDVFLSLPPVRADAYAAISRWGTGYLPPEREQAAGPPRWLRGLAGLRARAGRALQSISS
ncbi:Alpha/beta hydrolase family protein [Arthrobacter saudimassiliensis]|uniref:Alpha/beta hydrolase family protein n=1 Tax=Arthrobacter saudimassiliensis TaxID=1461584 RepID=A0A078MXD5_9MICC|nr:Alpha/beta hydrolase family protein [Arthrobacter saudimassiliensis]